MEIMEGQIDNIGQNAQQVGQNLEKSKINYWMLSTIVLGLILITGSLYEFSFKNQQVSNDKSSISQTPSLVLTQEKESVSMETWKTYQDKNNVFTLKYPPYLYETKETYINPDLTEVKDAGALSSTIPYNSGLEKEDELLIQMSIWPKHSGQTLDKYVETNILTQSNEDTTMSGTIRPPIKIVVNKRENISLTDGRTAVWLEGMSFMSVSHTEVFIPYRDSEIIQITIWDGTNQQLDKNLVQYEKNMKLAKQIISTFKFVSP